MDTHVTVLLVLVEKHLHIDLDTKSGNNEPVPHTLGIVCPWEYEVPSQTMWGYPALSYTIGLGALLPGLE